MNEVTLKGRLGGPPRSFMEGKGAEMRVATSRRVKDKSDPTGKKFTYTSDWHTVTVWREDAQYALQWGQKGSEVVITGEYITETFTRKDGTEGTKQVVKPNSFSIIIPNEYRKQTRQNNNNGGGGYQQQAPHQQAPQQQHAPQPPQGGYPGQPQPAGNVPYQDDVNF